MSQDEIDDITLAVELSLLDLDHHKGHFTATDKASSSSCYSNEDEDEDENFARAIKESLKTSKRRQRRTGRNGVVQNPVVCDVCDEIIKPNSKYGKREFWNQNFCQSHLFDTRICCGCMRLKTKEMEYTEVGDGRMICSDCNRTAITEYKQCTVLIKSCNAFYKTLNMKLRDDIPLSLVDGYEMARLTSNGVTTGPLHPTDVVWGLTIIQPHSDVETVSITRSLQNRFRKVQKQSTDCEIRIAILSNLPKVISGAILAHEMMHAWLRLQGAGNLEPKVEEGICQVIAHKYLEWYEAKYMNDFSSAVNGGHNDGEEVQFIKNLIETFKHGVELDSSKAYGDGFRDAQWAVAKYGLEPTINFILSHGKLPKK